MRDVLKRYFPYQFQYESSIAGYTAFQEADGWYIVIPTNSQDENNVMEQYVISDFLRQRGFQHIAIPVQSLAETFIIPIDSESSIILCQVHSLPDERYQNQLAKFLQAFHHEGHYFPYSPLYVNRYGQWKQNWEHIIDQFDWIRNSLMEKDYLTDWERLWLESSFYFIGIGENAIQYLQNSEEEKEFNHYDQPVFTFERIAPFPTQEIILPNRIVHDHPSRDLAEITRHYIMKSGRDGLGTISQMLHDYNSSRTLSVFSWRLFYARLLFPIQFIDYSSRTFNEQKEGDIEYRRLKDLISYQTEYEYCLKQINHHIKRQYQIELPEIDWIHN